MKQFQKIRRLAVDARDTLAAWLESETKGDTTPVFVTLNSLFTAYDPRACPQAQALMGRLLVLSREWANARLIDVRMMPDDLPLDLAALVDKIDEQPPKINWSSPSQMAAEGVPPAGIARAWRLLDDDGHPDLERVNRELAEPGYVITDEYRAAIEADVIAKMGFGPDAEITWQPPDRPPFQIEREREAAAGKPAGPSLDSMIVDGCNWTQISRWHPNINAEDVVKRARELGVTWPPDSSVQQMATAQYLTPSCSVDVALEIPITQLFSDDEIRAKYGDEEGERLIAAAAGTAVAEVSDIALEALAMHRDGLGVPEIARALKLKRPQVKRLIREAKKED